VPNTRELTDEARSYDNTLLMSDIEGRGGQGSITGLNGLLLAIARRRGLEGMCLLGEVPVYISQFPVPYPKASKSILEVLTSNLGITIDLTKLDDLAQELDRNIEAFYQKIPPEIRQRIEQLRHVSYVKETEPGSISEEDKKRIMQDVEEFFKRRGKED
jgi:hypothetical protein